MGIDVRICYTRNAVSGASASDSASRSQSVVYAPVPTVWAAAEEDSRLGGYVHMDLGHQQRIAARCTFATGRISVDSPVACRSKRICSASESTLQSCYAV